MTPFDDIDRELNTIIEMLSTRESPDGKKWQVISAGKTIMFDEASGVYKTACPQGAAFRLDGRGVRIGIVGTGIPYAYKDHPLFDDDTRAKDCIGSILQHKQTQAFEWRLPQSGNDVRYVSKQSIIEQGYYDQSNGQESHDLFTYRLLEREVFGATVYSAKVASSYAYTLNKATYHYEWEYRYDAYYSSAKSISTGIGWLLDQKVDVLCFTMEILGLPPLETESVETIFTKRMNSKIAAHGRDDAMLVICPVGNKQSDDTIPMGVFARSPSVICVSAIEVAPGGQTCYRPTPYAKLANASGAKPDLVGLGRTGRHRGTSYSPAQAAVVYTKILSLTRHYMNQVGFYPDDITPKFLYDEIIEPGSIQTDTSSSYVTQIGPGRLVNAAGAVDEFLRIFPNTRDQHMRDVILTRVSGLSLKSSLIQLPYPVQGAMTLVFELEQDADIDAIDLRIDPVIQSYTSLFEIGRRYVALGINDMDACYTALKRATAWTAALLFYQKDAPQSDAREVVLQFWPTENRVQPAPRGCVVLPEVYQGLSGKIEEYFNIFETVINNWEYIIQNMDFDRTISIQNMVKLLFNHIGTAKFLYANQGNPDMIRQWDASFDAHYTWLCENTGVTSNESAILCLNESLYRIKQGQKKLAGRYLDTIRNGCDAAIRKKVEHARLMIRHT